MARDGSGTFNLAEAAFVNGSTIDADAVNSDLADIASGLTGSIAKDGQTVPTANLPMGAFKHTGVADGSARTDYASLGQLAKGTVDYAADTGAADAYVIAPSPGIAANVVGFKAKWKVTNTNLTTTPTLAANLLTTGTIVWPDGSALAAGDLPAGAVVETVIASLSGSTPTWHLQTPTTLAGRLKNGLLTTRGDIIRRGASVPERVALGSVGQVLRSDGTDAAWSTPVAWAGARQAVAAGPLTSAGLPDFLPSTNGSLAITSQNVDGSHPLVASAANGWSASTGLPADTVGFSAANLTWSGLTASRAAATPNFLYGTISAAGVITPASTIVAPVYQWDGTPATTSGLITFNVAEMKAYLGNGATAPQTNLVLFGEAATDGSGVISTVAYAYNGIYEAAYTATLPSAGSTTTKSHNLGVPPQIFNFIAECTSGDATPGILLGEQASTLTGLVTIGGGGTVAPPSTNAGRNTAKMQLGDATAFAVWTFGGAGASLQALTAANYKWKFVCKRGW